MKEPVSSLAGAPSATAAHPLGAYASADYGVEDDRVVFTDESGAVLRLRVLPSVDATLSEVRSSLRRDPSTAGLRGGAVRIDSGDALLDAVSMRRLVVLLRMEYGISVAGLRCTPAALQRFAEQVLQTRVRFSGGALEMALFEGAPPSLDGIEPLILAALPPPPAPVVEPATAPAADVEDDVQLAITAPEADGPDTSTQVAMPEGPAPAVAPPLAPPAVDGGGGAQPAAEVLSVEVLPVEVAVAKPAAEPPAVTTPAAELPPVPVAAPAAVPAAVEAAVVAQAPVAVSPAPTGRGRRRRKGAEPVPAVAPVAPAAVEGPVATVDPAVSAAPAAAVDAPAAASPLVENSAPEGVPAAEAPASADKTEAAAAPAPALTADESSADLPTGPAASASAPAAAVTAAAPVSPAAAPPAAPPTKAAASPTSSTSLTVAAASPPQVIDAEDARRPGEVQPVWTREGDRRVLAISRTLRSGAIIRFAGDVVVYGDVNAGAHIEAGGNIVVLGSLRGLAHAGAQGDEEAIVLGFDLKPAQLRIADHIAFPLDSAAPRAGGLLSLFSRDRLAKGGFSPVVALLREGRIVLEDYRGRLPG